MPVWTWRNTIDAAARAMTPTTTRTSTGVGAGARAVKRRVPIKPFVFAACLGPAVWLGWLVASGGLGFNPQEAMNRFLGEWALNFLLAALAVTPARKAFGWTALARYRRMIGLFAFFYAVLHLASYVAFDQAFVWADIWADIVKRTYITLGMIAVVILTALAVTSPVAMVRKLGAKRWQALHKTVYAAGVLGCVHYLMMVKGFQIEPLIYGGVLAVLLGYRVLTHLRGRGRARST
jgi:sulfoxide reductase heme-binding subunit YedZ